MLEREFSCFDHNFKILLELGQGADVYRRKGTQDYFVQLHCSCYLKVASEVNVNDVSLRVFIVFMTYHVYELVFTYSIGEDDDYKR